MNNSNWMPSGIVPGICWLSQRIREYFEETGAELVEEDFIEVAFQHLDEGLEQLLVEVEASEDGVASSLWETCEAILQSLYSAWEEACESFLQDLGCRIASAYELMAELESKLSDDYSVSLCA